jgi:hypothetical protein
MTPGKYLNSSNQLITSLTLGVTDYIFVTPGERIIDHYFNGSSRVQGTFRMVCAFDANKNVIQSAGADSEVTYYDVPAGVSWIKVTIRLSYDNQLVVEPYTSTLAYKKVIYRIGEDSSLSNRISALENRVITVDPKGKGNYTTINAALNAAGDSASNPVTILVYPGVYVEPVRLVERYIHLVGLNRETCIIKTFTNDYLNPPMDIWCNSSAHNLSFIADSNETTNPAGLGNGRAYGAHVDQNLLYKNRKDAGGNVSKLEGVCVIDNCYIKSSYVNGLGGGTCPNSTIIVKNCEIESLATTDWAGLRMHNYPNTGTGQKFICDDNIIHNGGAMNPITLQDTNHISGSADNVDTEFTFRRNILYNETQGIATAADVGTV